MLLANLVVLCVAGTDFYYLTISNAYASFMVSPNLPHLPHKALAPPQVFIPFQPGVAFDVILAAAERLLENGIITLNPENPENSKNPNHPDNYNNLDNRDNPKNRNKYDYLNNPNRFQARPAPPCPARGVACANIRIPG
jgi:hypothetical protein